MNKLCICGETIAKSDNGVTKIRSKILIVRDAGVTAVCKGCGMEVSVDLEMKKAAPAPLGPPLILAK